jgi:leader peptidase (prepilin peptidase)/N-methyltransferase
MISLVIFLFGAVVGSFLNVCIARIPNRESIVIKPPSDCPNCKKAIALLWILNGLSLWELTSSQS